MNTLNGTFKLVKCIGYISIPCFTANLAEDGTLAGRRIDSYIYNCTKPLLATWLISFGSTTNTRTNSFEYKYWTLDLIS